MNTVVLIGNLVEDPNISKTGSGISRCSFRLAVQRRFANQQTGQREADFLNVVCWRQTADLCAKYLAKGRKAGVRGSIQSRTYEANDGSKRYAVEIVADEVQFLSFASGHPSGETTPGPANAEGYQEIEDDELPF